jgi:hypothetical protein
MRWIKQLYCKHKWVWKMNYYGDYVNMLNGKRSLWQCEKCGKWKRKKTLGDGEGYGIE